MLSYNPRTAGGLSHLRTAGGVDTPPPQKNTKLRKVAKSGKRRSIGCGKFYKKIISSFFDQVKFEATGAQKSQMFSKSGYFLRKS